MALERIVGLLRGARRRPEEPPTVEFGRALSVAALAGHAHLPGDVVRDRVTGQEVEVVKSVYRHVVTPASKR